MTYGSVISHDDSNYMICRLDDSNRNKSFNTHKIRKIIINYNDDTDKFSLEYDTTFNLDLYMGNHNISCSIVKKNNELKLYIMGGRPMSIINISNTWKEKWPSYCEDIKLIKEFLEERNLKFDDIFTITDGEHPILFRFVEQKMIKVETYIIMDKVLNFSKRFRKEIKDEFVYPAVQYKFDRYAEFMNFDSKKYGTIMKGVFT